MKMVLGLVLMVGIANAEEYYKCTDAAGNITISNVACPGQTTTEAQSLPKDAPSPPQPMRERHYRGEYPKPLVIEGQARREEDRAAWRCRWARDSEYLLLKRKPMAPYQNDPDYLRYREEQAQYCKGGWDTSEWGQSVNRPNPKGLR